MLLLLLLLLLRSRSAQGTTLFEELPRENVCIYNEEGGGEDDRVGGTFYSNVKLSWIKATLTFVLQAFDLTLLRRVLNNCPVVTCTEVLPTVQSHARYRHLHANEEICKFLKDVSKRVVNLGNISSIILSYVPLVPLESPRRRQ